MEAQLSAAKLKLEEHLSRLVPEEPASPEPEQVPRVPLSVLTTQRVSAIESPIEIPPCLSLSSALEC